MKIDCIIATENYLLQKGHIAVQFQWFILHYVQILLKLFIQYVQVKSTHLIYNIPTRKI